MKTVLWATNLSHPVSSLEDWAGVVDETMAEAKAQGAVLFVMPEYASIQWEHLQKEDMTPAEELVWSSGLCAKAVQLMSGLAKKHDMLLISGTFPCAQPQLDPGFTNRAHILFPDGRILTQEKLCLTPFEKVKGGWDMSPGRELTVFEWQGFKLAVLICLDIEMPSLSARIASQQIDLILVPSMTQRLAGYHRVFDCAKARAVELMAAVAAVGCIGGTPGGMQFIAGASVFLPCEEQFGHTGVLAAVPPGYTAEGTGPLLVADIPLADIRALRAGGKAEVWPGNWDASHVKITTV